MQYHVATKTVEEYLIAFPIQMEEVDKIIGIPTFAATNKVITALKTNCIAMDDERSGLGKLHCVMDSAHMEAGQVGVIASIDPGPITYAGLVDQAAKDNYLIEYHARKALWIADTNLKEAAKRFIFSRIDVQYLGQLAHPVTKFKGITIIDLIDYLRLEYPPQPEEVLLQEALLMEDWDPNNHIETLFTTVKEGIETLLQMEAIEVNQMAKLSIKFVYNAIQKTGQFPHACEKWKALPPIERETFRQIRVFFGNKYKVYDAQQNSLHQVGVANSVQLQDLQQATSDGFTSVRDQQVQQANFNTRILQMVQARNNDEMDDAATAFSALTVHSALKDKRIEDLEARLRSSSTITTQGSTVGTPGSTGTGTPARGTGRGRGRGRGDRTGGKGRGYRSRSDGPANFTKNGPYWDNDNYCWSCGYDCAINHDSGSCNRQADGHQVAATGNNPMGGSIKDKQFSKWK